MAPLGVAPYLIRAIGVRAFRKIALTGERIDASKALQLGLAHDVVRHDELVTAIATLVEDLMHAAPGAVQSLKVHLLSVVDGAPLQSEIQGCESEIKEGVASFRESRKPRWYLA